MKLTTRIITVGLLALIITAETARASDFKWLQDLPRHPGYPCPVGVSHYISWLREAPLDRALYFTLATVEESDPEQPPHVVTYVEGTLRLDRNGRLSGGGNKRYFNFSRSSARDPFHPIWTDAVGISIDPATPDRGVLFSDQAKSAFRFVTTACYDGALLFGISDTVPHGKLIIGFHQITIPG